MSLDDLLRSAAEPQHGLVSRSQARGLGASSAQLRTRLNGPDWEPFTHRVLRLVGAPRTVHQDLMGGALDSGPGSAVSHLAAAALWRLPGFGHCVVEVSRQRGRSGRRSMIATLHQPRLLLSSHVTEIHGIPLTTLPRTLFDLAGDRRVRPGRLERTLDSVLAKTPRMLPALHAMLEQLSEHGRDGLGRMRALLAERPAGYIGPTGLESRFMRIMAMAGELPLERQVDLGGEEWIGRVDFLDRASRMIVEVDSDRYHSSRLDRELDRRRDAYLQAAGWRDVVRITEEQVWHRPWEAVAMVRDTRRRAATADLAPETW